MSLLSRLLPEYRGAGPLENPNVPITADQLAAVLGVGGRTAAGVNVNQTNALRLVVVLACVGIITEAVSTLPAGVFVKEGDARVQVDDPKWLDEPNKEGLTSVELFEDWLVAMLTDGNSYTQIVRDRFADVSELFSIPPRSCEPRRTDKGIVFDTHFENGMKVLSSADCLHMRGMRQPGSIKGISPIEYARQAIGLGLATERFGAEFFGQGSVSSGVIETPAQLSVEQARIILNTWNQDHGGLSNAHRPGVLTEGAKWTQMSIAPDEAQFLETRHFQLAEIARLYRVPPHKIGELEKQTSFGTGLEELNISFVTDCLRPWIVRIEKRAARLLQPGQYLRFNVEGLLRGSTKERYEGYAKGREWGWLTVNDILALEDKARAPEGGDDRLVPMNMNRMGDEVARNMFWRSQAVNFLVQAGFDPADALAQVGLDPMHYVGPPQQTNPPALDPDTTDPNADPPT